MRRLREVALAKWLRSTYMAIVGTVVISLLLAGARTGVGESGYLRKQAPARSSVLTLVHPRVVVVKSQHLLYLFDGPRLVRQYPVDLGRAPKGQKLHRDDCRTPVGLFHLVTKNADSPYHRFLGIDYPDERAVRQGLKLGLLSAGEATSIRVALSQGRRPDWNTGLGGGVGVHGSRRRVDWTAGCLALCDRDVEELFRVLRVGDPIEILP